MSEQAILAGLSMALRVYDQVVRYLESRNVRVADLEARRQANGGRLSLQDLDDIERQAFSALEKIPE